MTAEETTFHYELLNAQVCALGEDLIRRIHAAGLPPIAMLDIAASLISTHGAVSEWQDAGANPNAEPRVASAQAVRESLGKTVEILRTLKLM